MYRVFRSGYWFTSAPPGFTPPSCLKNLQVGNASERNYKMTQRKRAIFCSRVMNMADRRRNTLKTFVLTYRLSADTSNTKKDLNRFLTNLRKNYALHAYAYTVENTKNGQIHYHFIADVPFIPVKTLNNIWCAARGDYAENALRALEAVKNHEKSAKYASKYFTKAEESPECIDESGKAVRKTRPYATSNNIQGNELMYWLHELGKINVNDLTSSSAFAVKTDYFTFGFLEQDTEYCVRWLEKHARKPENSYQIHYADA